MIAVTYLAGWALAHPVPVLIFLACAGTLAVLAIVTRAENRRDDRDTGIPQAPRREARNRARGTRARRRFLAGFCRRARAMRAWVTSWFWWLDSGPRPWQALRERLALRAHGITIDVTGGAAGDQLPLGPPHGLPVSGPGGAINVPGRDGKRSDSPPTSGEAPVSTTRPDTHLYGGPGHPAGDLTRLATGAERAAAAPWHAPEAAALSPWEHTTQWFSLDAIDADIRAREAAAAGGEA